MLDAAKAHIKLAKKEREHYKDGSKKCKASLEDEFRLPGGSVCVPVVALAPLARNIALHISFDFAQQVHLPSNPLQP